jgi:hypothetical protein
MEGFRYYQVRLRGLAPGLLMSNGQMSDPAGWYTTRLEALRGKEAAGEEIERQRLRYHVTGRLYLDEEKRIVLPAEMLSSALRKGASAVSKANGRKWWAGLMVMADAVLEVEGGLPVWDCLWEHDRFVLRTMWRGPPTACRSRATGPAFAPGRRPCRSRSTQAPSMPGC